MHYFTIRDVENLSGIKAHTLRMWEQRYGLNLCKRRESKHRYYDNEDLKYILRIAWLYHSGFRISRIAALSEDEINNLASQNYNADENESMVNQLVDAGLEYNQEQFEKSLRHAMKTMGLEKTIEKIVYPFFNKIGLLWLTNHLLPAQEHFCTFLIQKLIISAINALPAADNNKYRVFLFTPVKEMHDLPLLLAKYVFKKQGIKSIMAGSNCTIETVKYCCTHQPVTHLYFHLITNFTNCDINAYVKELSEEFADLKIIASGLALKDITSLPSNMQVLHSVHELLNFRLPG